MAFLSLSAGFGGVAAAFVLFLVTHSLPAMPSLRRRLVSRMGEPFYLTAYSVVSLATLCWLIAATLEAPYVALWDPPAWARPLALGVMPVACVLFVAGASSPNPLSVAATARGFDPARPGIVAVTRHPVLWGCLLWSAVHVLANGDLRAVLLFGTLGLFSAGALPLYDRRRARARGRAEWGRLAAGTSVVPLWALLSGDARWPAGWAFRVRVAAGLALYAVILAAHGELFGVSPLG
ncbi:MAG: NnrU family protein [Telmatospirillum sp.]|nr:NnrU family protein [Telmatospirillum sp.]